MMIQSVEERAVEQELEQYDHEVTEASVGFSEFPHDLCIYEEEVPVILNKFPLYTT